MIREYGKIGEFQVYGLRKQWNLAAQVGTNENLQMAATWLLYNDLELCNPKTNDFRF